MVATGKINVVSKSVLDISSLILRADLCGLTASRNAIIDQYDARKPYVKWTTRSLRTKLKDRLTVTLRFELRDRLKTKAAHWKRRNVRVLVTLARNVSP